MQVPVLVTGVAGFIGFHVARRLLADGWKIFGVDDLNDYYDPRLKKARLALLSRCVPSMFWKPVRTEPTLSVRLDSGRMFR